MLSKIPFRTFAKKLVKPFNPSYHKQPTSTTYDRTYRESLYSARRINCPIEQIGNTSADWQINLNRMLRNESISAEVRARRQFVRPAKRRIDALFKSRQGRFNEMFKKTVSKIMNIYESKR